jgi:hypothetical protein
MIRHPLMAALRVGSVFRTRKGHTYQVVRPMVQVSERGDESPCVIVEHAKHGRSQSLLLTLGILAHQTRGCRHVRGPGPVIDWSVVERRPQTRCGLPGIYHPVVARRAV